jgi:D-ornithine/D-lysine decarboxylase
MTKSWEIDGFLDIRNGQMHVDGVSAPGLVREHGSPLFVFSESRIRHNIDRLKKAADVIDRPLKLCYAAKAMSTMAILNAVKDAGCDVEVNSGGELWKALKIGFVGDQIIFNGTSKEIWELEMAITAEIYAIQVDSLYELSLIEETAKRLDKRAKVSLRLVPEIESATHRGLQTALLTSKFGMMPDEARGAFVNYRNSPHLNLHGIHLHVGSQNPDPAVYTDALRLLFESLARIHDESGLAIQHINLGGGFPVDYLRADVHGAAMPEEKAELFRSCFEPAEAIGAAWQAVKAAANAAGTTELLNNITLLLEPGRSVIADAGICLTTVRNKKIRPIANSPGSFDQWLMTDAGFNILLSMETYKWYYQIVSADRAGAENDQPYKLAGPLCDGGDVYFDIEGERRLPDHRMLPENVVPGQVLAILNCGAYSLAQASQYNGRALPPVVLIDRNGKPNLVRRRDSFEDLVNNDVY